MPLNKMPVTPNSSYNAVDTYLKKFDNFSELILYPPIKSMETMIKIIGHEAWTKAERNGISAALNSEMGIMGHRLIIQWEPKNLVEFIDEELAKL